MNIYYFSLKLVLFKNINICIIIIKLKILTGSLIPELLAPNDFPGVQPIFSNNLKPLFFVGIGLKYILI